jgi:hypothetical protein
MAGAVFGAAGAELEVMSGGALGTRPRWVIEVDELSILTACSGATRACVSVANLRELQTPVGAQIVGAASPVDNAARGCTVLDRFVTGSPGGRLAVSWLLAPRLGCLP